jgi:hypothetical protein
MHGYEQYGQRSTVFHFLLRKGKQFFAIIAVTALPSSLLLTLFTLALVPKADPLTVSILESLQWSQMGEDTCAYTSTFHGPDTCILI